MKLTNHQVKKIDSVVRSICDLYDKNNLSCAEIEVIHGLLKMIAAQETIFQGIGFDHMWYNSDFSKIGYINQDHEFIES